jgi:uncharacterized protein (TIRG00374 family)
MSKLRLLQVPLVLALFAFLAFQLDLDGLTDALSGADPAVVVIAVALNLPICALFGLRMHLVLRRLGHRLAPDLIVASAVVGNVAGALTPASSGEILRAAALRSHSDVSLDDAVALVVFERGLSLYLLSLGTLAAFSVTVLPAPAAIAACAACIAALTLPFFVAPILDHLPAGSGDSLVGRLVGRLRSMGGQLRFLLRSPSLLLPWFGVTAAIFATFTLQYWLLARSVEDVVSPIEVWIAFGASQLAAIASFIPLGLGASDASLAAILSKYGMSLESGTAVAILVRAASTLPLIVLAAASWVYLSRKAPIQRAPVGDVAPAID